MGGDDRRAEPALTARDDPRAFADVLRAVYDAAMTGARMPARPRTVIDQSWRRAAHAGVDPEAQPAVAPLDVGALAAARGASGLAGLLDDLTHGLSALVDGGDSLLVVADADGRVLWRAGESAVRRRADRLGFVEGASWAEESVGTNAIGTALASGRAVQVFSAEHYVRTHHAWTCTGAPILDPCTGDALGVVDVSGPAASIHPMTVALVDSVARLAHERLRAEHRDRLDLLRAVAAPILARPRAPALAVDGRGWVAAVDRVTPRRRVALPDIPAPGRFTLRDLGPCDVEPLPGGWLIRPVGVPDAETSAPTTVHVSVDAPTVRIVSAGGEWTHRASPRHRQILLLLAAHPSGLSAAELAGELFGDRDRTVTARAEMSRLRKTFGQLIAAGPYRFVDGVRPSVT